MCACASICLRVYFTCGARTHRDFRHKSSFWRNVTVRVSEYVCVSRARASSPIFTARLSLVSLLRKKAGQHAAARAGAEGASGRTSLGEWRSWERQNDVHVACQARERDAHCSPQRGTVDAAAREPTADNQ